MEHHLNFFDRELAFESGEDMPFQQKWKSNSAVKTVSKNEDGCFDCNICLESAHEPVVTLCGHLYCWPCIYKWLHVQTSSDETDQQQKCPVCKANISETSMVPLYGRGISPSEANGKKPNLGMVVPRRPPPCGLNTLISTTTSSLDLSPQLHPSYFHSRPQSFHQQYFPHPYGGYAADASAYIGGTAMSNLFNPNIGMFGEMVYARMFGSSNTSLFAYPYSATNPSTGISSRRMRRQEMQLDKSLTRVSVFFFCFLILCLLVF
ncbi:E3 ubiquitin-protein ligase RMA1H1 [Morella rubra]|uniref:E3 ubiquitin-protein ligase RMA n=1 Tax=Morella rubra TaxID=262757 RepID=A0A6A1VUE4_9ROSI|nr:E3 ubiquitin-protein ligase RMA1H1 [Morella rubra]